VSAGAAFVAAYPPCVPPRWARGGHVQTIASHFAPSRAPRLEPDVATGGRTRQLFVDLPDGDTLSVLERPGTSDVRVLVLHGLSGDTNADYVTRLAAVLDARGHGLWAVDHRGCGFGADLARHPYHSGCTEDLAALVAASRRAAPQLVHVVVGFSMSGNIALLHAGRREAHAPDAVVAVNPPVDLAAASRAVSRGLSRLYDLRFVTRLRRELARRRRAGTLVHDVHVPRFATLCDFDDLFTAPASGFASGADYHARCSALPHLPRIELPTVIVTARDDPFVDARVYAGLRLPDDVHVRVEEHGGHVGYLDRDWRRGSRWIDGALVHFVEALAARVRERRAPAATGDTEGCSVF
jgi:hypothetical protein